MALSGLALALLAAAPPQVFLQVDEAAALLAEGAVLLDARGAFAAAPFLPDAHVVDWMTLRDGLGRTGRLAAEDALLERFGELGVSDLRPVLVYGAADQGWGEEGRIWWTLRYLGHPQVFILDGGVRAWVRAGRPVAEAATRGRGVGRWRPVVQARLRARARELADAPRRNDVIVVDVRTREEFEGATPYLSPRGGHVPGALHLEWRRLLADDGRLLPRAELERRLAAADLRPDARVIAYCTGGVRSAFFAAVLSHLGYSDAANFDGSWWEWSSNEALPIELPGPVNGSRPGGH